MTLEQSDLITISEFLSLSAIPASRLITMLENGQLDFTRGPAGELLIDISKTTAQTLACYGEEQEKTLDEDQITILQETIATEIVSALDSMISEAFAMARQWRKNSRTGIED